MKNSNIKLSSSFLSTLMTMIFLLIGFNMNAQEMTEESNIVKVKAVKNTFEGVWLMDNQTVMVPVKGTFEFDIQHRFGTVNNGSEDLFGLFSPSNIRLGFNQ